MDNLIRIELDEKEVELFKKFRQYQNSVKILLESGFFEMRNGQAIINFSITGHIMKIILSRTSYQRTRLLDKSKRIEVV